MAAAIRDQNAQYAAGRLGAEPAPDDQVFTMSVTTNGQLVESEDFERIILRAEADGSVLRLGDVARVELGAQDYSFSAIYNGQPTVPLGIYLQPGANALETAENVRRTLDRAQARFPDDMAYAIPFDTTEFIDISIREVFNTLVIATVLVVLVTFVFSAAFSRHADSGTGDSGIAGRDLRRHDGAGFLDQFAHPFRPGSVHRHRCRQCDHRARERRAPDARERNEGA